MAIYLNVTDVNELVSILFSPNSDAHSQYIGVEMGFFPAQHQQQSVTNVIMVFPI